MCEFISLFSVFVLVGRFQEVELLSQMEAQFLDFLGLFILFSRKTAPVDIHTSSSFYPSTGFSFRSVLVSVVEDNISMLFDFYLFHVSFDDFYLFLEEVSVHLPIFYVA